MRTITVTLYHADWCGHCIKFEPIWEKFVDLAKADKLFDMNGNKVKVVTKDYVHRKNESIKNDNQLIESHNINSFPTIIVEDVAKYEYNGSKNDKDSFINGLKLRLEKSQEGGYDKYYKKYLKYKSKYMKLKSTHK